MLVPNYVWVPTAKLALTSNDIHIWWAALDQPEWRVQQLAQTLSVDESIRADRFHFEQDRKRFIARRGILRTLLGGYLGIEPDRLQFYYGSHGKPALAENSSGSTVRFNLSHSQGIAVYAVTRNSEIGIDIESIRFLSDAEQIAKRFFSAQEYAVFQTLTPSQKQPAFFKCWTCKEAYLKAIGDGLALPLDQFDVSLSPREPAKLLSIKGDSQSAHGWFLQELTPVSGYVAALAVEGYGWRTSCWQWSE